MQRLSTVTTTGSGGGGWGVGSVGEEQAFSVLPPMVATGRLDESGASAADAQCR